MAGNPNWCNINGMRTTQHLSPLIPSSSIIPQYPTPSLPLSTSNENQQLPYSWSQLLLGGGLVDEDRSSFNHFQPKKVENWEDQTIFTSSNSHLADVKQESSVSSYFYGHGNEEFQAIRSPWGQVLQASSPTSCVTTYSSNMLDFSHTKMEGRHQEPDHSSECNSTTIGSPFKKAKVQSSTVQSSIKVRKEKLGERITALHQLVSPFGKTDTASVLLEAIGYIRFLQSQIEALSSPYLATAASPNMSHPVQGERSCLFPEDPGQLLNDSCLKRRGSPEKDSLDGPKKDLRSRGLCLVPLSCTLRVGSDNGADYWAPNLAGGFR